MKQYSGAAVDAVRKYLAENEIDYKNRDNFFEFIFTFDGILKRPPFGYPCRF